MMLGDKHEKAGEVGSRRQCPGHIGGAGRRQEGREGGRKEQWSQLTFMEHWLYARVVLLA